jgi:hypothetical protein
MLSDATKLVIQKRDRSVGVRVRRDPATLLAFLLSALQA